MEKKEETVFHYEKHPFIFQKNTIFIPCTIDGHEDTIFFDTGYSFMLGENAQSDTDFQIKPIITHKIISASKAFWQKQGISVHDLHTPWVDSKNHVCTIHNIPFEESSKCIQKSKSDYKIVGLTLIPDFYNTLLLTFSDTTMTVLDSNMQYDTTGFTRVPALFKSPRGDHYTIPKIHLKLDSVYHDFLFDTGAECFLMVKNHSLHTKENEKAFVGEIGRDASGIMKDTLYLQAVTIPTWGTDSDCTCVYYQHHLKMDIMGILFISHYDWIIDRYRDVMYAKKIHSTSYDFDDNQYKVKEDSGHLKITMAPLKDAHNTLPLGLRIRSVDGVSITSDNICHYKQLLNSTTNWSIFRIEYEEPEKE